MGWAGGQYAIMSDGERTFANKGARDDYRAPLQYALIVPKDFTMSFSNTVRFVDQNRDFGFITWLMNMMPILVLTGPRFLQDNLAWDPVGIYSITWIWPIFWIKRRTISVIALSQFRKDRINSCTGRLPLFTLKADNDTSGLMVEVFCADWESDLYH